MDKTSPQEIARRLPHAPGVYIYRDNSGAILYVGKAKDLYKRVNQYFTRDNAVGEKTKLLVSQISTIETIKTHSEFDALLLEARLIREYVPKYNVIAKDDKSPLYIALTLDEELPRILYIRRPKTDEPVRTKWGERAFFGPFQSGRTARRLIRDIRKILPYCTQKQRNGKACFYTHLGLCDPCPSVISRLSADERREQTSRYRRSIYRLRDLLSGKSTTIRDDLLVEMKQAARQNEFEAAEKMRLQLAALRELHARHIDPYLYIQDEAFLEDVFTKESDALHLALTPFFSDLPPLARIECIDISNTQGAYATGSLVVLTGARPDTAQYRRFRIRTKEAPNDFAMVAEVVSRRFAHTEWQFPDLLVIDGGKGQLSSARETLARMHISLAVIGLAKREEEIIVATPKGFRALRLPLTGPAIHLLQRIRDEAHRFAISYHRLLRRKAERASASRV